ncbi:MAG: mechanosensitive ion channel family protein [Thermoplasmata archaeon]|nr:mechanosensitive ion channel family protein [Thermoplasmata archaeon]
MTPRRLTVWAALLRDIIATILTGIALTILLVSSRARLVPQPVSNVDFELLEAGVIVLVAYLFAWAFGRAIQAYMEAEGAARRVSIVRVLLNVLIALIAGFALFGLSGVSIQNLFFGSALAGVVLGLASQTVLGNMFAGLVIIVVGPFRPYERISIVSASYGAIGSTYPHELVYPAYSGTVLDVGLFYTTIQLDSGRVAKVPNSVVLTALVVHLTPRTLRSQRIRFTVPHRVTIAELEATLEQVRATVRGPRLDTPPARIEVADIAKETWDPVVVVWTTEPSEEQVRDAVLRCVLPAIGGAGTVAPAVSPANPGVGPQGNG